MRIIFTQPTAAGLAAVLCLASGVGLVRAADHETVDYRLVEWKTKHFHDAAKAGTHASTLRKLGCEVKRESHGGHIDVNYRCPEWRRMSASSHDEAHRWEEWLKSAGFATRHDH